MYFILVKHEFWLHPAAESGAAIKQMGCCAINRWKGEIQGQEDMQRRHSTDEKGWTQGPDKAQSGWKQLLRSQILLFTGTVSKWSQFRFHTWPSSEDTLPRQGSQRPILRPGRKKNIILISLKYPEHLPASLITSPGPLWSKQHQTQRGLVALVLSHDCLKLVQKAQRCNTPKVVPFVLRE